MKIVEGNLVDIINEKIYPAIIKIENNRIALIKRVDKDLERYIIPPLIDAHIHIESTMLSPIRFAEVALTHGTVSVVADPHEIANVLGIKGIFYMISEAKKTPLKAFFTAPSCVPAVDFESSGARIDENEIEKLMKMKEVVALGEVMNYPGVINREEKIMKKIEIAKKYKKPIDGHAPMLRGKDLKKYIEAGITTDHECTSIEEAEEKIKRGMKIMIREGSSSKNMNELIELSKSYNASKFFFVTDDINPRDLRNGHINLILRKALSLGLDAIIALKFVSINPITHYNLPVGCLKEGELADFVVVNNLREFNVIETWINGRCIVKNGKLLEKLPKPAKIKNVMRVKRVEEKDLKVVSKKKRNKIRVIKIIPNQIITKSEVFEMKAKRIYKNKVKDIEKNLYEISSDTKRDIIKIVAVDRYKGKNLAIGFVSGFNLKNAAIATSIAHDSHNIIAIGSNDNAIAIAINKLKEINGGVCIANSKKVLSFLKLLIAGLMSIENHEKVARNHEKIEKFIRKFGCKLEAPLMQLSFLALPVIPELKITTKGLFDVNSFSFVDLILG
ncbi:MAG: adenine deaminase [Candidatus Aenigmatarchaeota archaeon]|nr:adenine deaminase [Candidatus Aenigmarchaeota archaeon]